jgi:hypothetical protein
MGIEVRLQPKGRAAAANFRQVWTMASVSDQWGAFAA